MIQKGVRVLLAAALLVPLHVNAKKKCKTFCSIVAQCLRVNGNATITGTLTAGNIVAGSETITGNLSVGGNLTVGGTTTTNSLVTNSLTVGGTTFSSLVTLVNTLSAGSLIPFGSGPLDISATGLPTEGIVMGFGNNFILTGLPTPEDPIRFAEFSFAVPRAGTLHNLQASVDALFLIGVGPFSFTYQLWISPSTNGAPNPYVATPLSTNLTLTAPAVTPGLSSAFSSSAGSITVAQGDRVVIRVIPTDFVPIGAISLIGFNAGVLFTPA